MYCVWVCVLTRVHTVFALHTVGSKNASVLSNTDGPTEVGTHTYRARMTACYLRATDADRQQKRALVKSGYTILHKPRGFQYLNT